VRVRNSGPTFRTARTMGYASMKPNGFSENGTLTEGSLRTDWSAPRHRTPAGMRKGSEATLTLTRRTLHSGNQIRWCCPRELVDGLVRIIPFFRLTFLTPFPRKQLGKSALARVTIGAQDADAPIYIQSPRLGFQQRP
jgi:hypothetical protein